MSDSPSPISRVFLLDKPEGLSSFAALSTLKKRIGTRKVGHAGTLDPFATGLLTAMSGKMTKAASLLSDADKTYQTVIRFGEETDTCDPTGTVIAHSSVPDMTAIQRASKAFIGLILQKPPIFSAIKVQGRRAYESARKGISVSIPERQVNIHELEILTWEPPNLTIKVHCSKGTYIRSLARDLGLFCGCRAHCTQLRRLAVGPFTLDMTHSPEITNNGLSPEFFFRTLGIPVATVQESLAADIRHGRPIDTIRKRLNLPDSVSAAHLLVIGKNGKEIVLLASDEGRWKYKIIF